MKKLLLIIPAYNEQDCILATLESVERFKASTSLPYLLDFIVVNDGSKDQTAEIVRERGCSLIDLEINLGLAGAFMAGMQFAHKNGYDYAMQFDADGQHLPEYISQLVGAAESGADIAIGSRFISEKRKINSFRMMGNALISHAIWITTHHQLRDPTSGMRLKSKNAIDFYISRENSSPEADTISFMLKKGFSLKEVQVTMHKRQAGTSYLTWSKSIHFMLSRLFSILLIQPFRR
jgi:glycosyltransferase involved in cell wall biosynthesis